jgi:hypothetical protein
MTTIGQEPTFAFVEPMPSEDWMLSLSLLLRGLQLTAKSKAGLCIRGRATVILCVQLRRAV